MSTPANPFDGHELRSPTLSHEHARQLLHDRYRLAGTLSTLGSHQDQNLLVDTGEQKYVLKISNPGFPRTGLEAQNAAMRHVAAVDPTIRVPQPVPDVDGQLITSTDDGGRTFDVRVVTFLAGSPLSQAQYLAPTVVSELGRLAARSARALADFDHPGLDRLLQWDCRHALDVVRALGHHDPDTRRRDAMLRMTEAADAVVRGLGDALRVQVLHADVTDVNVVCTPNRAGQLVPDGLIDFGDIARTWVAADVAVAAVAMVLHAPSRPLEAAGHTLAGYHSALPLREEEVAAVWPLVVMRSALCAVSSLQQAGMEPHNVYAQESLADDLTVWDAVADVPPALADAFLRNRVGPSATATGWAPGCLVGPVVAGLSVDTAVPVDLSVTSEVLIGPVWDDPDAVTATVAAARLDGIPVAPWGEGRLPATRLDTADAPPTVALTADVFVDQGTVVLAPVSGQLRTVDATTVVVAASSVDVVLRGVRSTGEHDGEVSLGSPLGVTAEEGRGCLQVQVCQVPGLLPPASTTSALASAWKSLCPDPALLVGGVTSPAHESPDGLMERRDAVLPIQQEHYYGHPPRIERGWRHHLVDTDGRAYLDMVNNVAVLGHSHPAVAAAVSRQLNLLNTNSRFHYESMVDLAERIAGLLPRSLDTVFLVSTGSEANDLALRLVRAATGRRDVIAVQSSYHGWTTATDEVTTSLADNPNAAGRTVGWVHTVESPNTYRGRFQGEDAGPRYAHAAQVVVEQLVADGRPPAGFICEPLYGNSGGLPLPDGYLRTVYQAVRDAGGLCIADEVQVGYGRLGRHFWAFEQQGVVPDVVTLAKATGNGVPVAAVVCRRDVADALAEQGSFFSSVGGSPVSSAAGLAVLDVLAAEDLPGNAERVGAHLKARLEELAHRHELIGAVHGMGLYLGVELVRDRVTKEPATEEAWAICERMLDLGIVVQPTADHFNVLKVKPPLCVTRDSADFFVDQLDQVLATGW